MSTPDVVRHLTVLAEDAAICDACGLHENRTNSVFSRGSPHARLMFVGEAPGENEDLEGTPFVGRSGQLLDAMIAAMGLDRESDVYICNALKCRPPDNRRPTLDELKECSGFLINQIRLVRPKVIVALGKSASQALSPDVSPDVLFPKGWAGKWRRYGDIPLITTYHPAYLLRTPEAKKEVGRHLYQVREKLKHE